MLTRMAAEECLSDAGCKIIEAAHADEAVTILEANNAAIHVVFTDVSMPGTINGVQLAHHTRQHWPAIAIIVASAHPQHLLADLPLGSRFVAKPYQTEEVVRHVQELVCA